MTNFDVTAIGTAFVDVVANVTEDFLERYSLIKGQGKRGKGRTADDQQLAVFGGNAARILGIIE